jgi:hypothetical protein
MGGDVLLSKFFFLFGVKPSAEVFSSSPTLLWSPLKISWDFLSLFLLLLHVSVLLILVSNFAAVCFYSMVVSCSRKGLCWWEGLSWWGFYNCLA